MMMVEIEYKTLREALDLLHDYAYESERDGDVWKAKEVAICAQKVREVLFKTTRVGNYDWAKVLIERCKAGEKTLWSKETNEAYKKMLAEKKPEDRTPFDDKLERITREMDETYKKWEEEEDE